MPYVTIFFVLLLAGTLPARADYGSIKTSAGKTYEGNILPADGGFLVTGTNGSQRVNLRNVAHLKLQTPGPSNNPVLNALHGLRGTYFDSPDCTGDRVVRIDPVVDFNWQDCSPMPGIGPVDFSVRWEGKLQVPTAGKYTFYTQGEGARLWINNELVLEKSDHLAASDSSGARELETGKYYNIRMELYNRNLTAVARLFWSGPSVASGVIPNEYLYAVPLDPTDGAQLPRKGLLGMYFNTADLTGECINRFDPNIEFDWGEDAPVDGLHPGQFSVRWLGKLIPEYSEPYTFKIECENGARVWLNGNLIIDAWREEPVTASSVPVRLMAGEKADFKVEMFSTRGAGKARLEWSSPSTRPAVIPAASLLPVLPPQRQQRVAGDDTTPVGLRLSSGSFLASPIKTIDETSIELAGPQAVRQISLVNVARVVLQPLTPEFAARLVAGRTGLLLKNKDFIEGEFRGMVDGKIKINSILFGLKTYSVNDAITLVLRDLHPQPSAYEVRLRTGTVLRSDNLRVAEAGIVLQEPVLKQLQVAMGELHELGRTDGKHDEDSLVGAQASTSP